MRELLEKVRVNAVFFGISGFWVGSWASIELLDGRNRARVIAESLARVIAAIRITSVRWRSYLPPKTQNLVLADPAFVALRFESRDSIGVHWCGIRSTWTCGIACES